MLQKHKKMQNVNAFSQHVVLRQEKNKKIAMDQCCIFQNVNRFHREYEFLRPKSKTCKTTTPQKTTQEVEGGGKRGRWEGRKGGGGSLFLKGGWGGKGGGKHEREEEGWGEGRGRGAHVSRAACSARSPRCRMWATRGGGDDDDNDGDDDDDEDGDDDDEENSKKNEF